MRNGEQTMGGPPTKERDWKYMRSIHDELLHKLCADINERAVEIASGDASNPHEKYLALYRYIQDADGIIADCFDDWSRSRLGIKLLALRRRGLLTDQRVQHLSPEAREWLSNVAELEKMEPSMATDGDKD
jgi:hypothetical protein